MFGKTKDDTVGDRDSAPAPQVPRPAAASPAGSDAGSIISSGTTIVGKIVSDGTVNVFGRVEGEVRAATIEISAGAHVEGDLIAEDLTIGGNVKGTVHANRVKLSSTAVVEGDVFHRSLSIEENARFEGSSRREENAIDTPSRAQMSQSQSRPGAIDGGLKLNGAPDAQNKLANA